MTSDNLPKADAIRSQLDRILQSGEFKASVKQWNFLRFVIEEALAGRSQRLKGYTIAVMPLINLTGGKEQDYFADGLTEELTAEITRDQNFQVIAAQSTMTFKGLDVDPRKFGRDLGVQFRLKGSVRMDSKTN